uniref:Uncharacterized protein n=1 Tax=Bradyrhizobium amphicarpaeae TaxID=1404768 RepID=A0A2U8Q200_9BRAD|nr:hypothetical protein CIT40_30810 [Bradyrhizobium amphicarpaeae]
MGGFQASEGRAKTDSLFALSLRAQRSNPESLRGGILDCFVARAPRNDVWLELGSLLRECLPSRTVEGFAALTPSDHNDTTSTRSASRRRASSRPSSR